LSLSAISYDPPIWLVNQFEKNKIKLAVKLLAIIKNERQIKKNLRS
jgi:hypothetical protein